MSGALIGQQRTIPLDIHSLFGPQIVNRNFRLDLLTISSWAPIVGMEPIDENADTFPCSRLSVRFDHCLFLIRGPPKIDEITLAMSTYFPTWCIEHL